MTDYKKLVEALRLCSVDEYVPCKGCPMDEETHGKGLLEKGYFYILHQRAAAAIEELQRVNLEIFEDLPKLGEWINHKDEHQCSVCKETVVVDEIRWEQIGAYDYCPKCGAKMEVPE